ncbi:MAG: hypothetical protein H6745_31685 [Deltaproteobacteria bacterium]|nr:hypothetical protein [Deltaproteobacteria bacterium]
MSHRGGAARRAVLLAAGAAIALAAPGARAAKGDDDVCAALSATPACAPPKGATGALDRPRIGPTPPPPPSLSWGGAAGDQRSLWRSPRAAAAVAGTVQGLERALSAMPVAAAERPARIRELADAYVELEAACARDQADAERRAIEADQGHQAAVAAAARKAAITAGHKRATARQAAINRYEQLLREYPRHCREAPATGCADEVTLYLAFEHERAADADAARRSYLELLASWPQSSFTKDVWAAMGDLAYEAALTAPAKWATVAQMYEEVVRTPGGARYEPYAHYRLGFVAWHRGQAEQALTELEAAIGVARRPGAPPGSAEVADAARAVVGAVYGLVGTPAGAFARLHPSRPTGPTGSPSLTG